MAGKSYTNLKAVIIAKVAALQGGDSTDLFAGVYGVKESEVAGFPCAYVLEHLGGGSILDTHRNEREWQFQLVIDVKVGENRTPEQAYAAMLDAVDRVITSFDEDPMLLDGNGAAQCKWVRVVPAEFEWGAEDGAFHRANLVLAVVDIVNRYAE